MVINENENHTYVLWKICMCVKWARFYMGELTSKVLLWILQISLWKIWTSFTRADPGDAIWAASPVTLFGAATSGGKKADKRLLFGRVRRRGQRAESWTGISNQSCNSTLHKASTFFASVGALDISKILWLGHFWDNRQQELRTQGSQTGSHLGNRCS